MKLSFNNQIKEIGFTDALEVATNKLFVLASQKTIPMWKVYDVEHIENMENNCKRYDVALYDTEDMSGDPVFKTAIEVYDNTIEIDLGE
ncbi:hypothetical protein L2D08_16860 [Domibacillus sp. PGB-M46]|uniref:hypothetical protein n=1 Tax=Domibacillus sp. PGB-M46 TaxID=2910255 RepID=UPI001F5A386E|nr:hypothetical protein [Domibacillus sp. PGB-M46]MCI2256025.1 hypothetical protein [Domibacillus sp. PGB-M46]